MSAPGLGVNDILVFIKKCKDIYTSFASEYDSAPGRVQELVDTCNYLSTVFKDVTAVEGDGMPPALQRTFERKLEECNHFIERYRLLKKDYLAEHHASSMTERLRRHWDTAWQTGLYAFELKSAKELRDALELETVKLLAFLMTSMRNRANNDTSLTNSTHHAPGYDPTWIENLFARLRSINNRYWREISASTQSMLTGTGASREPDLSGVYAEMFGVWNDFCAPPAWSRAGAVINATAPSVHYGLPRPGRAQTVDSVLLVDGPDSLSASPNIFMLTQPSSGRFTLPTPSSATTPLGIPCETPVVFQSPSSPVPPPDLYRATVYVTLVNESLKLTEWRVDRSGAMAKIIWTAERPPGVLEHIFPKDVFPETLHSSQRRTMHVTFPYPKDGEEHHLIWRPDDGSHSRTIRYDRIIPEYYFVSPEARRVFQSHVRDKDLVDGGTFDTDVIWTDRSEARYEKRESYAQDLKLWRGRRGRLHEGRYSLSFNVTNFGAYSNRHVECELHRFVPTARTGGKDPRVVYLDFAAGSDGRATSQSSSTAATDELGDTSGGSQAPGSPPQQRKKRGLSGIFKRTSQSVEKPKAKRVSVSSHGSLQLFALEHDFFANLRYLAVEFSDVEDAGGHLVETGSSVANRFRKLFDGKRREEANRSPFSLPNPHFITVNFDDLGESAVSVSSHEEPPRCASRDVSPTSLSPTTHLQSPPGSGRARTPSDLLGVQYAQYQ